VYPKACTFMSCACYAYMHTDLECMRIRRGVSTHPEAFVDNKGNLFIPHVVQHTVSGQQDYITRLQLELVHCGTLTGVTVLVWPWAGQLEGHVEAVLLRLHHKPRLANLSQA